MIKISSAIIGLAIVMCSCAATTDDKTTVFVSRSNDPAYVGPNNDLALDTLNIRDNTIQTVPMRPEVEEANYQASLVSINARMKNEWSRLEICAGSYGNGAFCKELNKKLCTVDELIDTRGDIHRKPYCVDPLTKRQK